MAEPVNLALGLAYAAVLVAATVTDLKGRRIPNWLTLPGLALALVVAALNGTLAASIVGAMFAAAVFILPAFLYGAAGGGDVKLAAFVGAALGMSGVATALLVAGIAGAVVVGVGLATRRIERRQKVPFGPFIALGGIVGLLTL